MTTVEFGSLFEFIRNGMSVRQDKSGEGLPITRIETISEAVVDSSRVGYAGLEEKDCNGWLLQPGDILFSHINSVEHIGKCAVYEGTPEKLVHGMNLLCLRPDKSKLTPKFGKYLIRSSAFRTRLFNYVNKAVNQASVSIGNLKPIEVSVPPLPEQKRIVAILDKADSIRRKRQEAVRLAEELLRSVFLEMFGDPVTNPKGWETLCMKEIVLDGPQNGLYKHESDYGSGTQIVRIDSFYDGEVTGIDNLKRVRLDDGTIQKYLLQEDDLLINRVNSRKFLGKSAIVPKLKEPTVFESNMMRIAVNKKIVCPHYLVSLLQHQYIKTQIDNKAKDAVNQSSINQDDVKSFELRIPPLELQSKFKDTKRKIYGLFQRQNKTVEVENNLFNSLIQCVFKGEL